MTNFAVFSDEAEKILPGLTPAELRAVEHVRAQLELTPRLGERRPSYDPQAEDYVVRLDPEETGGRGVSVLHRHHPTLGASLITWVIVGP
ncbi:hypothetical protein ACFXPX_04940 [Kitasatospora sp. NPDC059146]|uniref:hypothetical protein n=1 Tax=unclassified Kitasatospora TaxID=2633591 RepID=UPI0036A5F2F6